MCAFKHSDPLFQETFYFVYRGLTLCLLHSIKFPHLVMGSLKSSLNGLVLSQHSAMTTCRGHGNGWNKWQLLHASDTLALPRHPYAALKKGLVGGWARCNAACTRSACEIPWYPSAFLPACCVHRLSCALHTLCKFPQHHDVIVTSHSMGLDAFLGLRASGDTDSG